MPELFPPEILNYTAESYYSRLNGKSKIIYLSVLLFSIGSLILIPVIKIEVSTQSRGIIRSPMENIIIQPSVSGEIISSFVYENKPVLAGDTLFILSTKQIDEQINFQIQKKNNNDTFIGDIHSLLSGRSNLASDRYKSEYKRYHSKIDEDKIATEYLRKEYEAARQLYTKNIISKFEYLQQKNDWDKAYASSYSTIDEFRTSWQSEQTQLELDNENILSTIRQLEDEKRNYVLTAPVSGKLFQVSGLQPGNFITPNQTMAYISFSDSLLAECYISPLDIGYIKEGQSAVFQVDAFNYREWGSIEGNVVEILNDVIVVSDKPMFRVRCKLDYPCLHLKNGYEGCVQKGMTLTGRFFLTKRSLGQLIFDKVDNWMNPKVIKDEY